MLAFGTMGGVQPSAPFLITAKASYTYQEILERAKDYARRWRLGNRNTVPDHPAKAAQSS